jgi:hypothetical protein
MIMANMEAVPSAYGHLCEMGHGIRIAVGPHLLHSDARLLAVHLLRVEDRTESRLWLIGYGEFERRCQDYRSAIFAWRADHFDNVSAEDAVARIYALEGKFLENALLVAKSDGRLGIPRVVEERRRFFIRAMTEDIRYTFGARLKLGLDPHLLVEGITGISYGQFLPLEHEPRLAEALARNFYSALAWGWLHFPLPAQDRPRRADPETVAMILSAFN